MIHMLITQQAKIQRIDTKQLLEGLILKFQLSKLLRDMHLSQQ